MRICIFCRSPLTTDSRAKEHVLRNSWLRELGHRKTELALGKFSKHGFIGEQRLVADQLQAGEVCAACNGGWMDYLDRRVEHIVLGLAREPGTGISVDRDDARTLARWLLKTACAFIHTDSRERRHIPRAVLSRVRRDGFLPPGFVAFGARSSVAERGIGIANLDMWPFSSMQRLNATSQMGRLKFGVRYDNVLLGCSYVNCEAPVFEGIAGFHIPLVVSRAKFELAPPPAGPLDGWIEPPKGVDPTILNTFLLLVGMR